MERRITSLALCVGVSIAASGCYTASVTPGGGDGGHATSDGGVAASDGGAAGCAGQDAMGDGLCDAILGWSFDGESCVLHSGCDCVGADCDALFESAGECERAYRACIEPGPGACDAQDARGEGGCRAVIGVVWDGRRCATIGGCECVGADCGEIFGTIAECEGAYAACGEASCAEQALPSDDCDGPTRSFGWRWDGGACEEVLRCGCSGASCDALYASARECEAAHGSCPAAATRCDPNEVWCRALPPSCGAGEVPSVIDHCWGPCVPFAECGPIACGADLLPCPEGLRCGGTVCVR